MSGTSHKQNYKLSENINKELNFYKVFTNMLLKKWSIPKNLMNDFTKYDMVEGGGGEGTLNTEFAFQN